MNEMFKNTMVACAAIAVSVGGGAAIVNGASSLMDVKIESLLVKREQSQAAQDAANGGVVVDALVKGAKSFVK
jgi:hypothetical protein